MNDRYDSELVHAIDQQVLNESEPFYEGNGEFRVELPDDPVERVTAIVVEDQKLQNVLDIYAETIERELQAVFGFETRENAT